MPFALFLLIHGMACRANQSNGQNVKVFLLIFLVHHISFSVKITDNGMEY